MLYFLILLPVAVILGSAIVTYNREGFYVSHILRSIFVAAAISFAISAVGIYLRAVAFPDTNWGLPKHVDKASNTLEDFGSNIRKNRVETENKKWSGDFWEEYMKNK